MAAVTEVTVIPENPVQGDIVTIILTADPSEEIDIEISYNKTVQVSEGRYEFGLDQVEIPSPPNSFAVKAVNVKNLSVSVFIIVWLTESAEGENGIATVSHSDVPSGKYDVRIHGFALDDASTVELEITATTRIITDENGRYEHTYDTSSIPPGEFKAIIDGITKTITLREPVCEITWFRVNPHWFSPNGDGRRDTTTIRATFSTTANWTLTIRPESAGDLIREWTGTGPSLNTAWNGTDGTGAVVPDGTYRVQLIIECAVGGDRKGRSTVVDNTPPTITDVTASPDPFDPSTETTDVCYTLSKQCRVTIKIFSAETRTLKRMLIRMQEQSEGLNCEAWDGRDGSGVVVPLGVYLIKMFAWDRAGNRALPPARQRVRVS